MNNSIYVIIVLCVVIGIIVLAIFYNIWTMPERLQGEKKKEPNKIVSFWSRISRFFKGFFTSFSSTEEEPKPTTNPNLNPK